MSEPTTRPTVDAILAAPEKFGIAFEMQNLEHQKMELKDCPVVVHLDLDLVKATFGDAMLLYALNQTSWRVRDQDIARTMRWKDHAVTADAIKRRQIEARFGIRATVIRGPAGVQGLDGKLYADATQAKAANLAHLIDSGVEPELAKKIVGV